MGHVRALIVLTEGMILFAILKIALCSAFTLSTSAGKIIIHHRKVKNAAKSRKEHIDR